jgi:16S rRNA (cytosine967-C5)-methyltransferase
MNSRIIATQVLCRVLKEGQSLTAALETDLKTVNDNQIRAFIQALCYGVIRNYQSLDFLLSLLLDKPLRNKDIDIKVLLLIGLYQLKDMQVKDHAAVAETVAAVGKKTWAKGVINAVLRQYLRDQHLLNAKVNSDLVAVSLHPRWLLEAIHQDWPEQASKILLHNNEQPPMTLRVNLNHITPAAYCHFLTEIGIAAHPIVYSSTAIQLTNAVPVEQLPYFADGWVSVQDAAAQFAAPLLELKAGLRVLDMCAAPGGKTAAILEMQPSVDLTAIDIDENRLKRVQENLQRLDLSVFKNDCCRGDLSRLHIINGDAAKPETWWNGQPFDRILLDAPCSALGVIRRHPDIKLLRRASDIETLQHKQQQMLEAAWSMLASGGILLYVTCSILKAENEQQITAFLNNHSDSFEIPITADWGQQRSAGRQILTGESNMDGFYYARIGKR